MKHFIRIKLACFKGRVVVYFPNVFFHVGSRAGYTFVSPRNAFGFTIEVYAPKQVRPSRFSLIKYQGE
jgi:hypothetical protein